MCQMCDEYEAELKRMGIVDGVRVGDRTLDTPAPETQRPLARARAASPSGTPAPRQHERQENAP